MTHFHRILVISGLMVFAVLVSAVGLSKQNFALSALLTLLLFVVGMALYLLPTALAVYRDCKSAVWIVIVNVFLGWTVFGWFAALGWAASGETLPPAISGTHGHPMPGH